MPNPLDKYKKQISANNPLSKYSKKEVLVSEDNPLKKYVKQEQPEGQKDNQIIKTAKNYLKYAQPAFKLAIARPASFFGNVPISSQEVEKVSKSSWGELLREAHPKTKTSTLGQIATEAGGGLLDLGTKPSSYIAGFGVEQGSKLALTKMATSPIGREILKKYVPNFSKNLLQGTAEQFKYGEWLRNPKVSPTAKDLINQPKTSMEFATKEIPKVAEKIDPEMIGSLRVSKFPKEVRPVIEQASPEKPATRSFVQQRATAESLKPAIDIDTIRPNELLIAENRRAVALNVVDNAKSALASGNLEEMQKVYGQIQKINNLHSEAGRLLGSLRDPLFDADDEAVKLLHDGLRRVIPESKESLAKFFKQATQPGLWDKFMEYRTASMLTSPYTHERNIIGNTVGRFFKIPERVLAGGYDSIRSFITKQPRERYATEALADIVGSKRGVSLGINRAINALLNEDFSMSSRTAEAVRFGKAIPGMAGKIIRLPFRALNAMDEFFSTWAKTSDLYSQAYREAVKSGADDVIGRTAELIKKPSFEMIARANEEALKQTFRQPLGAVGSGIQKTLVKSKMGKFIVPFFRTAINLFKWTFDRSPLGIYKLATKSFYKLPSGQMADEIGKMAFGQLISAGIAMQVYDGNITGRLSDDKNKREALMRQGIMPYSIKIGNKYVSYRGFEPISSLMALLSNSVETWKNNGEEPNIEKVTKILFETMKFAKDQPFLMGIKDVFNALDDPDRYGQRLAQNMITSTTIPTGVGYISDLQDPTIREAETIPQAIQKRLPGFSRKLPPKLDIWGNPITKEGTLMQRVINPAGVVTEKPDMLEQELLNLEIFPSKINKKYRNLPLSIDERNTITKAEGGLIKRVLDRAVRSSEYKQMDNFDKQKNIEKIITTIKSEVRKTFFEKKIVDKLKTFRNREEKVKYIQELIDKKVI